MILWFLSHSLLSGAFCVKVERLLFFHSVGALVVEDLEAPARHWILAGQDTWYTKKIAKEKCKWMSHGMFLLVTHAYGEGMQVIGELIGNGQNGNLLNWFAEKMPRGAALEWGLKIRAMMVVYKVAGGNLETPSRREELASELVQLWKSVTSAINHGTLNDNKEVVNNALVPSLDRI